MSTADSVLVLTTREKAWWWSMEEILPTIERVWTGIGESGRADVRMFCAPVEPEDELDLHTFASRATRIVVTVVTPGTVSAAVHLRRRMNVATPMILYLYGDSTEGLHAFGAIADILTERDTFVASSEADAAVTRYCLPHARVDVIPFPVVDQFKLTGGERATRPEATRLAYVGRVSEQKNLHILLLALWILRTAHGGTPGLDVYGSADGLGSPNMGLTFPDYGTYLRDLARKLGLDDVVTWHGFKPRDWLFDNVHLLPHVFVSATLHSDENFGSSVLASLVNGAQVVTTAWGGHFGFREPFSEQLTLVPVHRSATGPVVEPVALANCIKRAMGRTSVIVDDDVLERARAAFTESTVTTRALDVLGRRGGPPVPLEKSPNQRHLDEQRARFGGGRKIFENYADPVAHAFFEAYGMKEPLTFDESWPYLLPPWVTYADHVLSVEDPHRGRQSHRVDERITTPRDVMMCPSLDTCRLPMSLVKRLVTQGYAFSLSGGAQNTEYPATSKKMAGEPRF